MNREGIINLANKLGIDLVAYASNEKWVQAHCPFAKWRHASGYDKRPSFGINVNAGGVSTYKCFACNSSGRLPRLVRELGALRSVNLLALADEIQKEEIFKIKKFNDWSTKRAIKAQESEEEQFISIEQNKINIQSYKNFPSASGHWYVEHRGIDYKTAMKLDLRLDLEEERVLFPVYDRKNILRGYTGRYFGKKSDEEVLRVKDYFGLKKRMYFLGENTIYPNDRIVLTEGLFDYAKIRASGFKSLGALGIGLSEFKIKKLISFNCPVIVFYDNDFAAEQAMYGILKNNMFSGEGLLSKLYKRVPVFTVTYPGEEYKDAGELSIEQIQNMVKTARLYTERNLTYNRL